MAFFLVTCLLVIGVIAVIVGALTSSATAFGLAAVVSAAAIFVLWRVTRSPSEQTFVTDAPDRTTPQWDKSLRPARDDLEPLDLEDHVVVIDGYDELVAAEILPSLETLSVEQLQAVIRRERKGLSRLSVLERAQTLIDLTKLPQNDVVVEMDAPPTPRRETAAQRAARERPPMRRTTGTRSNPARSNTKDRDRRPKRGPSMGL
jgi:hypothetical protein